MINVNADTSHSDFIGASLMEELQMENQRAVIGQSKDSHLFTHELCTLLHIYRTGGFDQSKVNSRDQL